MSLKILTFISTHLFSALFLLFTLGCSSKHIHQMEIKGVVYDSENQTPIQGAKIQIEVSNPLQKMELSTDKEGQYVFSDSGFDVMLEDFLSEEDLVLATRKVRVRINHADFIDDFFEEEVKAVPIDPVTLDVGAFYLVPKDKEPVEVPHSTEE